MDGLWQAHPICISNQPSVDGRNAMRQARQPHDHTLTVRRPTGRKEYKSLY